MRTEIKHRNKQEVIEWLEKEVELAKKFHFFMLRSFLVTEIEDVIAALKENENETSGISD